MKVKFFKKTLHLKRENEETVQDFYNSDDLFWNDLYIETSDEWKYLWDTGDNVVYALDSYHWDWIDELKKDKTLILHAMPNNPEYEFNKEDK